MQHRTKRDSALINLISEFESIRREGDRVYFEDKEFHQLIEYYEDEHQLDEAIEVANLALEQYKYNAEFYVIKARLHLNLDEVDEALDFIERGERISPMDVELKILKARAYSHLGMIEEALEILDSDKFCDHNEARIELLMCQSVILEGERDYQAMYDILKEVLFINPFNEDALERIWMSVELSKNYKDSIKFHQQLIDKAPYCYLAWYNLGHAFACEGAYHHAIEALEYSFIINPEFEIGYKDCGELCFQINDFATALNVYLEALDQFENDVELLTSVGQCYLELGNYKTAKIYLSKASRIDPYYDEIYYYLGLCASKEKKWASTINYILKAIKIDDRREEYYANLAHAYAQLEEYTSADYYYHKATETGPEEPLFWFEHAKFLFEIEQYDAALIVLEEAEYHTFGLELVLCRAAILYRQGEKQKALDLILEVTEDEGGSINAFLDLVPEYKVDRDLLSLMKYLKS